MSAPIQQPPSRRRILYILLLLLGGALAVPVGYITWAYVSWQHGDALAESLGLVPPDSQCMIKSWEPEDEMDVDPRQFCNTTLKRNKGSVVELEERKAAAEARQRWLESQ